MAIAHRVTLTTTLDVDTASMNVNMPSGVQAGDLLIMWMTTRASPVTITLTGWTVGKAPVVFNSSGSDTATAMWWKLASGAEPSSYAVTFSETCRAVAMVSAYVGVDATTPVQQVQRGTVASNPISWSTTSIATTLTGAWTVWMTSSMRNSSTLAGHTYTNSTGTDVERADAAVTAGSYRPSQAVYDSAGSAAVGNHSRTFTASIAPYTGTIVWYMVELKPSAAPTVVRRVLGDDGVWYNVATTPTKMLGDDGVWYPITDANVYDGSTWKSIGA